MRGTSPVFGQAAHKTQRVDGEQDLVSRLTPPEGWMALLALLVMAVTVAFAIDDATWAGHIMGTRDTQTSFLIMGAVLSVLVGLAIARSSLTMVRAHAVGATIGAFFLLYSVSGAISDAPAIAERLRAVSDSVNLFAWEVFVLEVRSSETSVFLLTIGALLWAAGQFAAFSVFRRQRPLPAIAVLAVPLLINVALTVREQYPHVIFFAAGALLLLVRLNLLQQVRSWQARAIGEASHVSAAFLRAGAVFVAVALVGSITLAANTSSAPLGSVWRNLDERLLEVGLKVNQMVGGVTGAARGPSVLFMPVQTIREVWESSDAIDFTAITSDPSPRGHRWRGMVFDSFDGRTWSQGNRQTYVVDATDDLLAATGEPIAEDPRRQQILVEITPQEHVGPVFVSPDGPLRLNQRAEMQAHLEQDATLGGFVSGRLLDGVTQGEPYALIAAVRPRDGEGALTANELAAAGVHYPEWVNRYREIRDGSIGPIVYSQTNDIVAGLAPEKRNPYHIAEAVQNWLRRTGGFRYNTDVRGFCTGRNFVDCFLEMKQGYCEYFASAMVMMLRTQAIPARYVVGYLPGRLGAEGVWEVPRSAAHAWVEVYFPGYGWVTFDPTPGNTENVNEPTALAEGDPVPLPPQGIPSPPWGFEDPGDIFEREAVFPVPSGGGGGSNLALPLVVGAIILAALLLLAFAQLRRLPRTEPELAYRSVARIASRFGHGPRPTQTVYEFADSLGQAVPSVRSELRVVATAKVETTYGAKRLPADALEALRRAYARARIGLLRLIWRRPRGPRGPRSIE